MLKRFFRTEKGSVSVEFAVTMAFLVFPMFIGTIDVSRLINTNNILTRAAREGAVAASRGNDAAQVVNFYVDGAGLDVTKTTVSTTESTDAAVGGTSVRVDVVYSLSDFSLFPVDAFLPSGLQAVAVTKKE